MSPKVKALSNVIVAILQRLETTMTQREFYDALTSVNERVLGWLIWRTWTKNSYE